MLLAQRTYATAETFALSTHGNAICALKVLSAFSS